ncbi:MAG: DUF2071 domain-containing protein [Verrucomicrobia bacterium]|nr:DUF2071 domain-containing protein [Verrucomicrobiota bacterium]
MLTKLRRHPIPIAAHFRYSFVLTYAFPEALLRPLLPPGLILDTYEGNGFLAIAMVQTERLRPVGFPAWLGRNFFLCGYRIFSRFQNRAGHRLRGLRILRSDADSLLMVKAGNLLTHYNYRKCCVQADMTEKQLRINVQSAGGIADLSVVAQLDAFPSTPPPDSPFPDLQTARRFAGPMPFTFDYEQHSDSMVVIQGVRTHWTPQPVSVTVAHCGFLNTPPFCEIKPRLANAFLVTDVPYRWERGLVEPLTGVPHA